MINLYKVKKDARKNLTKNFLPIVITLFLVGIIPLIVKLIGSFITEPIYVEIEKLLELYVLPDISNYYRQIILSQIASAYSACCLWDLLFGLIELFAFCFELSLIAMFS